MRDLVADERHDRDESRPASSPLALRAVLMFAQIFLMVAALTLAKALRDGVFLARFAVRDLACVSLLLALLSAAAVALHGRFVAARLSRGNAAVASLTVVAASLVALAPALRAHVAWAPWVFFLWVGIFGLLLVAQFWITVLDVFDAREAKRVLALVASGASLGGVFGGHLAKTLSNDLGEAGLLFLLAAMFAGCALLAKVSWALRAHNDWVLHAPSARRGGALEGAWVLARSPLLRALAALSLCSVVAGTLLDWQLKAAAKAHYHSDRGAITEFFGQTLALVSLTALVLQGGCGLLLRRAGVSTGLIVLPGVVIAGALLVTGCTEVGLSLVAALRVAKIAEGGVRFSIDKAALELLYLPVSAPDRASGKALIDTVADRVGGAVAALIWLLLESALQIGRPGHVHRVSYVIAAVAVLWVLIALRARMHYLDAFRAALSRLELRPERLAGRIADAAQRRALEEALASARPAEVLLALDLLADPENLRVRVPLATVLSHPYAAVRTRALEVLALRRDLTTVKPAARLLADPAPEVRDAAVRWAIALGAERVARLAGDALPEPARRTLSVAAMAPSERGRALARMAASPLAAERAAAAALASGTRDVALFEILRRDPEPVVARAAIAALAAQRDPRDHELLLRAAAEPRTRRQAIEALARFGVAPAIVACLNDPRAPARERSAAAEALGRCGKPEAVKALAAVLPAAHGNLRAVIIRALVDIERDTGASPPEALVVTEVRRSVASMATLAAAALALQSARDPVVSLAVRAAKEAIDRALVTLFDLLALCASPREMRDAYLALRAGGARAQAAAIEYIDNVLPAAIRVVVVPIIEAQTTPRWLAVMARAATDPPSSGTEALIDLASHEEPWLRAVAISALLRQGLGAPEIPCRDREDDPRVQQVLEAAR